MAFNLATFKTRSLTAVVFVIVMVAGLVLNNWSFFILFSIIHFGCWFEYQKLVGLIDKEYAFISPVHKYGVMLAGWCVMLSFTNEEFYIGGVWLHNPKWWLLTIFGVVVLADLSQAEKRPKNLAHSIFGLVYISLSCGLMIDLYDHAFMVQVQNAKEPFAHLHAAFPWFVPAFIIACMWINDTMAYIVGSLIGKTPFSKISPKKTWEGTVGGIILCIFVAGCIGNKTNQLGVKSFNHIPAYHWYVMAGIASIAGTAGDLLESKLKRLAGVKDSGHIMPGHGGFLDRFDSLLVATPFVWLYLQLAL
jgi:phosphatidate cytidylyltransferase